MNAKPLLRLKSSWGLTGNNYNIDIVFQQFLISHISNKYLIYQLPYELPNDIRLRKLDNAHDIFADGRAWVPTLEKKKTLEIRKLGKIKKISKLHRIIT